MAFLTTVAGLFIRGVVNPFFGDGLPYLTLFPALAFCAWYCGVGPSILSVALSLFGVRYWGVPMFEPTNSKRSIGMLVFLLASGVVVYMGEARRREIERLRTE